MSLGETVPFKPLCLTLSHPSHATNVQVLETIKMACKHNISICVGAISPRQK
jgi:hypothetical protein